MEQNRAENTSSQQQNVHLHMHHMCSCQGNVYPTYYPAVGYRTPVPSLLTYPPPPVPRPYLQHYQYTQYNMGNQYSVPISHVANTAPIYGTSVTSTDVVINAVARERREKAGSQDENSEVERLNEVSNCEYGQITPPASELLLTDNAETTTPENFVKFLERSCLTAEQIAYRNRNRPCFRNIQNLCIRTRSEILKPCTTISNIHSQGIPWATKDFIYAFVRLTNCWHILKGYWENRDGASLGKIEKELTPEFRACYVRWEKETMELAAQLTRVFYNLDTNLVTPQVNVIKTPAPTECLVKKVSTVENVTTSTLTNISINNFRSKNVRGIIRLPATPVTETVDQANQTYAGDFCNVKEEGFDSEEERRVYMKPGSYNVPKRDSNDGGTVASPRAIEFLETAQNINKAQAANDRYWANINVSGAKKTGDPKILQDVTPESEIEQLNLSSHLNVHEWLLSSNFSDFGEPSPVSTSTHDMRTFFVDASTFYESLPQLDTDMQKSSSIKVLQRGKPSNRNEKESAANGLITDGPVRAFRKTPKRSIGIYENEEGITDTGITVLQDLLNELRKYDILEGLDASDKNCYAPIIDLDVIVNRLKTEEYIFVNEVIRDLKYLINYFSAFADHFTNVDNKKRELVSFITEMFSLKLRDFLLEHFPGYDFSEIKGDVLQVVGQLKMKVPKFSDEDQFYK
ncbi:unnamed protein product [Psylliodes chrysocephalus]|uniref:Uncharacterized protein n=1 Tax=Psylliodes chrysocephalus TaxID=3402493 RepID=A0A9P0D9V9_9CUCU|nr:unnamed protein product [Psylliodes chrysocephala]